MALENSTGRHTSFDLHMTLLSLKLFSVKPELEHFPWWPNKGSVIDANKIFA
jgi:hypothetical protein